MAQAYMRLKRDQDAIPVLEEALETRSQFLFEHMLADSLLLQIMIRRQDWSGLEEVHKQRMARRSELFTEASVAARIPRMEYANWLVQRQRLAEATSPCNKLRTAGSRSGRGASCAHVGSGNAARHVFCAGPPRRSELMGRNGEIL